MMETSSPEMLARPVHNPTKWLILGQGVKSALVETHHGDRRMTIDSEYDSQGLREKLQAVKELVERGYIHGLLVASGTKTASADLVEQGAEARQSAWEQARTAVIAEHNADYRPTDAEITTRFFADNETLPEEERRSYISQRQLLGRASLASEKEMVMQTSEADLMEDFLRRAKAKSEGISFFNRVARLLHRTKVWKESEAANSNLNGLYFLQKLFDDNGGKPYDGPIGVVTNNNGHMERIVETLVMFGVPRERIVPIVPEPVLRRFGYGTYERQNDPSHSQISLDRIEIMNTSDKTLTGMGKWLIGLQRYPDYTLPQLVTLKSDVQLRQILGALEGNYKRFGVDMLKGHPELAGYMTMDGNELRQKLKAIQRDRDLAGWEQYLDLGKMRSTIDAYASATNTWIDAQRRNILS